MGIGSVQSLNFPLILQKRQDTLLAFLQHSVIAPAAKARQDNFAYRLNPELLLIGEGGYRVLYNDMAQAILWLEDRT